MKRMALLCVLAAALAYGADFSGKSTDELLGMRGTMKTVEERHQLHNELQHRYETMTQEQKRRFESRPANRQGMGPGNGMGSGGGMGSGMGGGRGPR